MGTCQSSNTPTNSSLTRPYDHPETHLTSDRVQSSNLNDSELVLSVQPFALTPSYSSLNPQFPQLVKMSQLADKCALESSKPSQLARLSSRLPKFTFSRKPTLNDQSAQQPSTSTTVRRKDKISSSSSLSSADAGSSANSCKSSESLTVGKCRLGSHKSMSEKHFKTSTATIANPGSSSCLTNTTNPTKPVSLYSNNAKPKSTSSLIRPKSLLSKYQSKVSPQPSKVSIMKSSSDQECSSKPTTKSPLKFTAAITNVAKPQVAQLVLTNSVHSQTRPSPPDKSPANLHKKTLNTNQPASFGFKTSNSYNPYKRNQPPITKRVCTNITPTTTSTIATSTTAVPSKLITRSSGALLSSKDASTATDKGSSRVQLPLPGTKLAFTSQMNHLPTFGRLNSSNACSAVQALTKKLSESQLNNSRATTAVNKTQSAKDQLDFGRPGGFKMMHRVKKSPLTSAGNSNTVSSESNSYTSSSNSPDKNSHETSRLDFLIDDEICDQPELILNEKNEPIERPGSDHTISNLSSLQSSPAKSTISCSINELATLKMKQASFETSNVVGEESRNGTPTIRHSNSFSGVRHSVNTFRLPRPVSVVESTDGTIEMDGSSKRSIMQDINGIKTLLFRLQGEIQSVS
jgi:hypothetical protein